MRRSASNLVRIALLASACSSFGVSAGTIYKCVADGVTAYQSMPCERAQSEARISVFGGESASRPAPLAATPPVQRTPRAGPWRHQALALGMSDDEVLNMPTWGRPTRIVRTRLARGWQEVWTYGNAVAGERELRFTNARLTDVSDAAPSQVALSRQ